MKHKRITITGGKGFLGKHLIKAFETRGYDHILVADLPDYNLIRPEDIRRLYDEQRPDVVIHLAAKVGGIGFNQENPGSLFYENIMMGVQLLHEAYLRKISKFVALGTICAYPKFTPVPFKEDDLWNGYPEETNAPYGVAKKALLVQGQAYRQQYGFNAVHLLPVNLYGPGDNFDPASSHVIPALIKKVIDAREAGQSFIDVWGTGSASREFLFVRDAAEGIALAADRYDEPDPVNLGNGREITIRALTELICELCDFAGELRWDSSKPDGQPRRCLDTSRAKERFGWAATTEFRDGLHETISWYEKSGRKR
jgi:GDP-L-fucose synthase